MKFKNLNIETRRKYYSYLLWIGSCLPSPSKEKKRIEFIPYMSFKMKEIPKPM